MALKESSVSFLPIESKKDPFIKVSNFPSRREGNGYVVQRLGVDA